jgi:hypothetical protein
MIEPSLTLSNPHYLHDNPNLIYPEKKLIFARKNDIRYDDFYSGSVKFPLIRCLSDTWNQGKGQIDMMYGTLHKTSFFGGNCFVSVNMLLKPLMSRLFSKPEVGKEIDLT